MPGTEQETTLNTFELESHDRREPDGTGARWQPWPSRTRATRWLKQRWRALSTLLALLVIILSLAGAIPTPDHPVPPAPTVISGSGSSLLWSPDGSRLLLLVGPAATIWQPNLPAWL